jgi:N-acetyl-1-D-myo-inositol-2-amino-2-deoxy-alpha-D-glucopyranoside deacetylase
MLSPLVTFFWAIPLGILMGLAGTLMHQVKATNPEHTPIGLIVALISVGALSVALRLLRSSRGALYLTSITFGITVFTLAQKQVGGEVLIPANDLGLIWSYGSIALCAVIILFPQIRPAAWRKSASGHS